MSISEIRVRPFRDTDTSELDIFRELFRTDGRTDAPFGYSNIGVETAVAEKAERTIGAVTATKSIVVNFMKDPAAAGTDIYAAVLMGERALAYVAQANGVVEAYCAIPKHLTEYINMVKRSGYSEIFSDCVVLRRALAPETNISK
jgi:hypothetical protein